MEVHSHTHTARKKWTHYLWEFIMLFLAVFCGFLAENQREHFIEHRREKAFMASILDDIRSDTAMLALMHQSFSRITNHIDSLIPLLQNEDSLNTYAKEIYRHQVMLSLFARWRYSDRTISQLKNSGNFRLVRNKAVSDGIISYDAYVRSYVDNMQSEYILPIWRSLNDASVEIFKAGVVRKKFKSAGWKEGSVELPPPPYFIRADESTIKKFANRIEQYALAIEWGNLNIKNALKGAVTLDSLIRAEYHIE